MGVFEHLFAPTWQNIDVSSIPAAESVSGLPPVLASSDEIVFEPGDQLIVQCDRRLPRDVLDRLRAQLADPDAKFILLEDGLKLVGRRKGDA